MAEMKEQIKLVAQRIQALREVEGLTEEEMAAKTGVSLEEYRKYESGEADYSFTFVYKMARACGVSITDILEGESANLSSYAITRHGGGMPIARETGFKYFNLAPLFKDKLAEPFFVKVPYEPEALEQPIPLVTHKGQEFNIILKGRMKYQLGESIEYLNVGDTIYHDGETPHGMVALDGPAELCAVVLNPGEGESSSEVKRVFMPPSPIEKRAASVLSKPVADSFIKTETDENGVLTRIEFTPDADHFNFAYDVVDALAVKCPNKLAMLHLTKHKTERRFTFAEMSRYSNMAANYFKSLGIKKGDRVMLVLKRHYQFWFAILGLHKIGAVVVPATNQLVAHDFDYRFKAGQISAIV
ncbi:MAG: AMP-binding protein, partial [Firmicutes bacterium]|nr:AMP-binding protein [Bacillota bacterium]